MQASINAYDNFVNSINSADPTPEDTDAECGDIYYTKSAFPWNDWPETSEHQQVNDDSTQTYQGFATITSKRVGLDNVLIVAWEDDRHSEDTGEPNSIYDIYAAIIDED